MYEKDLEGKTILKAKMDDFDMSLTLYFTDGTECTISTTPEECCGHNVELVLE
jgi:hypothetical protein